MSKVNLQGQQNFHRQKEGIEEITQVKMKEDAQWFSETLFSRNDRIEIQAEFLDSINANPPPKKSSVRSQPSTMEQAQEMAAYAAQSPLAHRLMAQCQQAALEFARSTKRT